MLLIGQVGFSFAALTRFWAQVEPRLALVGIRSMWPFLFDTLFTIVRRWWRGENIFQAHRSHLYQRLVIAGYSHRTVTLLYSGLTLIGVAVGLAWCAGVPGSGVSILVLALSLPVALVWFVNSRENQGQQVAAVLGPPTSPSLPQ